MTRDCVSISYTIFMAEIVAGGCAISCPMAVAAHRARIRQRATRQNDGLNTMRVRYMLRYGADEEVPILKPMLSCSGPDCLPEDAGPTRGSADRGVRIVILHVPCEGASRNNTKGHIRAEQRIADGGGVGHVRESDAGGGRGMRVEGRVRVTRGLCSEVGRIGKLEAAGTQLCSRQDAGCGEQNRRDQRRHPTACR